MEKPLIKPANACFSSGPCAKRPGWSIDQLDTICMGRSHRSKPAKKQLKEIVDRTRALLKIPDDYHIGITPASDTGAVELVMWNLLGAPGIGVDVYAWEQFSLMWLQDVVEELKIPDYRAFQAPYGGMPNLMTMQPDRDAVFVWNGTTGGARIPNAEAFPAGDTGLRICDATSAVFAYDMPWEKLDVVTWSWQKVMGSEAQHGMVVFSPKALKRLETHTPTWPIPKIFQLKTAGKVDMPFFEGVTINTPSMLCVADCLDSLKWMEKIGGLEAIKERVETNYRTLSSWVDQTPWIDYLAADPVTRSKTSVCLHFVDPAFTALDPKKQQLVVDHMVTLLEDHAAGYDLKSYKTAPLGLRIWCGGTVESSNLKALTPWLEWAYHTALAEKAA